MKNFAIEIAAAIAIASPIQAIAQTLTNGSFESTNATSYEFGGFNTRFGTWGTDLSASVTAENGIVPLDGSRMLKFLADFFPPQPSGVSGDVAQLLPMGPGQLIQGSAYFNRVSTIGTDFRMAIALRAYGGNISGFPNVAVAPLRESIVEISTDSDITTWEQVSTQLLTPTGTTYIGFWVITFDHITSGSTTFLGNYADLASISAVPEPGTFAIALLGTLAVFGLARRRQ